MTAARKPLRHKYSKRQAKPLSQNGILSIKDANRSIAEKKAKREKTAAPKLHNQYKKH
jgi:hypothetical protein